MATKKQNKRGAVRRVRRALNACMEFFTRASGKRLNQSRWGGGLKRSDLREERQRDE